MSVLCVVWGFCLFGLVFFPPSVAYSRRPHGTDHHESFTCIVTVAWCKTCTEREKINSHASWKLNPPKMILKHKSKTLLVALRKMFHVCFQS